MFINFVEKSCKMQDLELIWLIFLANRCGFLAKQMKKSCLLGNYVIFYNFLQLFFTILIVNFFLQEYGKVEFHYIF